MGLLQQHILKYTSSQGASVRDLLARLGQTTSRRTLQRALSELVVQGFLELRGQARSARYYPIENKLVDDVLIAEDSKDILAYIRAPLSKRHAVSYNIEFIESYHPNESFYLGTSLRNHLQQMGVVDNKVRPAGTYGRNILGRLLIDLSWASSRLEGNTYSRLDTERLILSGKQAEGSNASDTQMILNHKAAIEFIVDDIQHIDFSLHNFFNLHGLLSENLMMDPDASGRLRNRPVDIGGSVYKPHALPQVIANSFALILDKVKHIQDPFEQAFFLMVHIPYLQPFEDVNKRVARLGANISLLKNNLCPLTFIDVPERSYIDAYLGVYEMNRIELLRDVFTWAYERSVREYMAVSKSMAEPDPLYLKYREPLHALIHQIVTENIKNPLPLIEEVAKAQEHQDAFIEIVVDTLKRLHPGVLARYKINPNDYHKWKYTHL